jgi:hypothetical protein
MLSGRQGILVPPQPEILRCPPELSAQFSINAIGQSGDRAIVSLVVLPGVAEESDQAREIS